MYISKEKRVAKTFKSTQNNIHEWAQRKVPWYDLRKFLWRDLINKIVSKAEKGVNLLRSVSHTNWEADPTAEIVLHRNWIRSSTDDGSIFYSQVPYSENLCSGEQIAIVAMQNTPKSNLYVETWLMLLSLRK